MNVELVAQMFKNYQSNVLFHLEGSTLRSQAVIRSADDRCSDGQFEGAVLRARHQINEQRQHGGQPLVDRNETKDDSPDNADDLASIGPTQLPSGRNTVPTVSIRRHVAARTSHGR